MPVPNPTRPGPGRDERDRHRQQGFTLLELLVVLVLVSIMLALGVPRFRNSLFSDPLKLAARQITGSVRQSRQQAITSEKGCFLIITFEEKKLQLSCPKQPVVADEESDPEPEEQTGEEATPDKSILLPDGVRIESIFNGAGHRFAGGVVRLWINPRGLMEPAIFNLQSGDDIISLSFSPFLPEVRLADQLITPDDAEEVAL